MSANTKIEWADHTFNPWIGCTKVGPGCDNCYAKAQWEDRRHRVVWGAGQDRSRTKTWGDPVTWNKAADAFFAEHGRRQRVFCASLADVFDNAAPDEWRQDLANLILNTPNLDWLLLTKRIGNAGQMLGSMFLDGPPDNLWLGATIVNQEEADRDIPKLLRVPAAKRFLSMEPLLGHVDLRLPTRLFMTGRGPYGTEEPIAMCDHCCNGDRCDDPTHFERGRPDWQVRCPHCRGTGKGRPIDWVIVGGESGPGARPMHPDWARSLRDQCEHAGVPFLFKQWGDWGEPDSIERTGIANHGWFESDREDGGVPRHEWPGPMRQGVELASMRPEVFKVGKKAAGRLLDGRAWDGFPS